MVHAVLQRELSPLAANQSEVGSAQHLSSRIIHSMIVIRRSTDGDFGAMLSIINDAALAYREVIPADRWHEPYMPSDELTKEISDGVMFWVAEADGHVQGVMGVQDKGDVALVRHAYVATTAQRSGIGTRLLRHLETLTHKHTLIGTW